MTERLATVSNFQIESNFVVMEFHWCSMVPGGQDNPIELVRGLGDSRRAAWAVHVWPPSGIWMHALPG